jgi:PAS domain S-box-containing protein
MSKSRIRRNVFLPVVVGLVLLTAIIATSLYWHQSQRLDERISIRLAIVSQALKNQLDSDVGTLTALMESVKQDTSLQQAFLSGNRDRLLKVVSPLLQELREKHGVTNVYFVDTNRVCFLRGYEPTKYGDVIDRFTMVDAATTDRPTHGIELGPMGLLCLRVVHPWKVGDRLIGYIELGENINQVLPRIKTVADVQLIATIEKWHLNRAEWEAGMKELGQEASWNRFADFVVVNSTLPDTSPSIDAILTLPPSAPDGRIYAASLERTLYRGGRLPLTDANGVDVGSLVALVDVTRDAQVLVESFLTIVAATVVFFMVLAFLFWAYLGREERSLAAAVAQIQEAKDQAEQTAVRLSTLSEAVEQSPAGILIADSLGCIEYANSGVSRMTGYTVGDLVGKHIHILQSDKYSSKFFARIQGILLGGETWRGTVGFQKRSGEVFWGNTTFAPVLDKKGVASHVVAVITETTDSKPAAVADMAEAARLPEALRMPVAGTETGGPAGVVS